MTRKENRLLFTLSDRAFSPKGDKVREEKQNQHENHSMKKTIAEQNEAKEKLLGWIKRGDTVYTICDHVSRSGMMRHIRLVVPLIGDDGKIHFIHPNYAAATLLGYSQVKKGNNALKVGGCGMDMGFHLVYSLSHSMFGEGCALKHQWL